ncbi:hypothetical protein Btru_023220 [Bulinus truncatus]|nr:hypothetical protein Btru_023220 [Bulinus truncatus]
MASFKTAREQIIRSKLAQLAMFSKNASESLKDEKSVSERDKGEVQKHDTVSEKPVELTEEANSDVNLAPMDLDDIKRLAMMLSASKKKNSEKSFVFHKIISNLGGKINSGSVDLNTLYISELDSCFRYGIYFPKQEPNIYVMEIFIDMCQAGKDVVLPDFLQTSARLSLVNQKTASEEIIGSEEGIFYISKLREQGWFEMASLPLGWLELLKDKVSFIHDNSLCIKFVITVCLNQVEVNTEIPILKQGNDVMISSILESDSDNEDDSLDDNDISSDNVTIFEDSYYFTLPDFDMCDNKSVICEGDEWFLEFLGHSIKAVLFFSEDKTLDIFLDFFHGFPDKLPEIALFK